MDDKLFSLLEKMPGIAYQCRFKNQRDFTFISLKIGEICGYTREEILTDTPGLDEIIFRADKKRVHKTLKQAEKEGNEYEIEYRIKTAADQIIWLRDLGQPEKITSDETTVFNGFLRDITHEKENETNLQRQSSALRERVKELHTIYSLNKIMQTGPEIPLKNTLGKLTETIRKGFSFPERTEVNISINDTSSRAGSVKKTEYNFSENINVDGKNIGTITVAIGPQKKNKKEKSYILPEEKELIRAISFQLSQYLKQQEIVKELKRKEKKLEQITQNVDEIIWISNVEKDNMIYVSPAYEEIWDRPVESLYEDPASFLETVHEEDREMVERELEKQAKGNYDIEYRIIKSDGTVCWVHDRAYPVKDDAGKVVRIVGIVKDITERKQMIDTLISQRDFLTRAQESGQIGFWDWDLEDDSIFCNQKTQELLGTDIKTSVDFFELVHPEDKNIVKEKIDAAIKTGDPAQFEYRIKNKKINSYIWIEERSKCEYKDGKPVRMAGTFIDISQQKAAKLKLEKMLKEKKLLLREVHHRVRNNLQTIIGFLSLQARNLSSQEGYRALMNTKKRIHAISVLHNLLYDSAELTEIPFKTYVEELINNLVGDISYKPKDLETTLKVDPEIILNPDLMITCGSIITELVINALKHAIKPGRGDRLEISFVKKENNYILTIYDNGPGLKPADNQKEGFGLELVKNTVKNKLEGEIIYSGKEGTRWKIKFPAKPYPVRKDKQLLAQEMATQIARALLENICLGCMLYNPEEKKIVYANKLGKNITGSQKAKLINREGQAFIKINNRKEIPVNKTVLSRPLAPLMLLEIQKLPDSKKLDLPPRKSFREQWQILKNKGKQTGGITIISFEKSTHGDSEEFPDRLLTYEIYRRLKKIIPAEYPVACWSNRELAAALPKEKTRELISQMQEKLNEPYNIRNQTVHLQIKQWVIFNEKDLDSPKPLLQKAEQALKRASQMKGPSLEFYNHEKLSGTSGINLRHDFYRGLHEDHFELRFQPQFTAKNNLRGAEILVRWRHPDRGVLLPGEFLPWLESSGLIIFLGEWILNRGLSCIEENFCKQPGFPLVFSFNLSPRQFMDPQLVTNLKAEITKHNLKNNNLEFEITETTLLDSFEQSLEVITELKNLHTSIALDDFGSGYSSLKYLSKLPIDNLKIDRSFIAEIEDINQLNILEAIVYLAKNLNLKTTLEGIETPQQEKMAKKLGINYMQGYYFDRPLTVDKFLKIIDGQISE